MAEILSKGRAIPRIAAFTVGEGRVVDVIWDDGSMSTVDLMPAFASHRGFVRLRTDDDLFRYASLGEYGGYLAWPDGSELSSAWIDRLRHSSLGNAEFRDAMDALKVSLDGMAAELGVSRRLIADYRKDKPIPKAVALATRYLLDQRKAS